VEIEKCWLDSPPQLRCNLHKESGQELGSAHLIRRKVLAELIIQKAQAAHRFRVAISRAGGLPRHQVSHAPLLPIVQSPAGQFNEKKSAKKEINSGLAHLGRSAFHRQYCIGYAKAEDVGIDLGLPR